MSRYLIPLTRSAGMGLAALYGSGCGGAFGPELRHAIGLREQLVVGAPDQRPFEPRAAFGRGAFAGGSDASVGLANAAGREHFFSRPGNGRAGHRGGPVASRSTRGRIAWPARSGPGR